MQMDIAVLGGGPGSPKHLYKPWDGNVGMLAAPLGSTPVASSSANQANAAATALLNGVAAQTTYLTEVVINVGGATAQGLVIATITGLLGGTMSIPINVPAGATLANAPIQLSFAGGLPASGPNQSITVTLPALGAGNTAASVTASGFQL